MRLKPRAVDCDTLTRLQIKSRLQTTLYNTLSSHHSLLLFIPAVTSGYWLFKGFSGSLINKKRAEEKTKWLSASTTRRPRKEERKKSSQLKLLSWNMKSMCAIIDLHMKWMSFSIQSCGLFTATGPHYLFMLPHEYSHLFCVMALRQGRGGGRGVGGRGGYCTHYTVITAHKRAALEHSSNTVNS